MKVVDEEIEKVKDNEKKVVDEEIEKVKDNENLGTCEATIEMMK